MILQRSIINSSTQELCSPASHKNPLALKDTVVLCINQSISTTVLSRRVSRLLSLSTKPVCYSVDRIDRIAVVWSCVYRRVCNRVVDSTVDGEKEDFPTATRASRRPALHNNIGSVDRRQDWLRTVLRPSNVLYIHEQRPMVGGIGNSPWRNVKPRWHSRSVSSCSLLGEKTQHTKASSVGCLLVLRCTGLILREACKLCQCRTLG